MDCLGLGWEVEGIFCEGFMEMFALGFQELPKMPQDTGHNREWDPK